MKVLIQKATTVSALIFSALSFQACNKNFQAMDKQSLLSETQIFAAGVSGDGTDTTISGLCYDRQLEKFVTCPPGATPTPVGYTPTPNPPTTNPPTTNPTAVPTAPPTTNPPTTNPTAVPTAPPTTNPPTTNPTAVPTAPPTTNPPTTNPTAVPTAPPTTNPPTTNPTAVPTAVPTALPVTGNPMNVPITATCNVQVNRYLNAQTAGEMKVVFFTNSSATTEVCEVATSDVRSNLLNYKTISVTAAELKASCGNMATGSYYATILPQNNQWANDTAEYNGYFAGIFPVKVKTSNNQPAVTFDSSKGDSTGNVKDGKPLVLWGTAAVAGCDQTDSPLVVNINREGNTPRSLELSAPTNGILFDILGINAKPVAHTKKQISWFLTPAIAHDNLFLVLPDHKAGVAGIDDMFGNNTQGPDGQTASDGFAALAKYDGLKAKGGFNKKFRDGVIDKNDAVFSYLRLWSDDNLDGIAQPEEMHTLSDYGITSIDLTPYDKKPESDVYGNKIMLKSSVTTDTGAMHMIYDLWFRAL